MALVLMFNWLVIRPSIQLTTCDSKSTTGQRIQVSALSNWAVQPIGLLDVAPLPGGSEALPISVSAMVWAGSLLGAPPLRDSHLYRGCPWGPLPPIFTQWFSSILPSLSAGTTTWTTLMV